MSICYYVYSNTRENECLRGSGESNAEESETTAHNQDGSICKSNLSSPNSGVLMPPPNFVPVANKREVVRTKIVETNCKPSPVLLSDKDGIFDSLINPAAAVKVKRVHCSVPRSNIVCYTNGNVVGDVYTKSLLRQQIHNKMYRKMPMFEHLRVAPKLGMDDTKKEENNEFTTMKRDEEYFKNKLMKIEHVDVHSMGLPLRCSTPTPSIDGYTVMAGQEGKIEESDDISVDDTHDSDERLTEILIPFINKKSKNKRFMDKEKEVSLVKEEYKEEYFSVVEGKFEETYEEKASLTEIKEEELSEVRCEHEETKSIGNMTKCKQWVQHSGNTSEPPPSNVLDNNTGDFGNTTLNITSVSHGCQPKTGNQNIGRGVETFYSKPKPKPMQMFV